MLNGITKFKTGFNIADSQVLKITADTLYNMPSPLWENDTTAVADASTWIHYNNLPMTDEGDYVKITVGANSAGAYLPLKNISNMDGTASYLNYEVTFTAYISATQVDAEIALHQLTGNQPTWNLTTTPTLFKYKGVAEIDNATGEFLRFNNLDEGTIVYVKNDVTVNKMIEDRTYIAPPIFRGTTVEWDKPDETQQDVELTYADYANAGVDSIRIQANYSNQGTTSKADYLDAFVAGIINVHVPLLEQYNMKAIVAWENPPTDGTLEKRDINYWNPDGAYDYTQDFIDAAESLASGLNHISNDTIFAYQVMSEPVGIVDDSEYVWSTAEPKIWYTLNEDIISTIRTYDVNKFICFSGGIWGSASSLHDKVPFDDNYIIYNAHNFETKAYTHQLLSGYPISAYTQSVKDDMTNRMMDLVTYQTRNGGTLPIMIGSYAIVNWVADRNEWLDDFYEVANTYNIPTIHFISLGSTAFKAWDLRYNSEGYTAEVGFPPVYDYDLTATNVGWTSFKGSFLYTLTDGTDTLTDGTNILEG